jgi:hypothetical protein
MRIRMTRRPGQPGTLHELATYGDKLVCVRYRYDEATHKRHKTVELIIETIDWSPPPAKIPPETPVYVRVERIEIELRNQVKRAKAMWYPAIRLWRLRYDAALALGIEDRIDWEASQR